MKKGILFIVFVLFANICFGQSFGVCDYTTVLWSPVSYDSTNFSDTFSHTYFNIDTAYHNNIWQSGQIAKSGFPTSVYGGAGMQTDTSLSYPINNQSSLEVWSDKIGYAASIDFWHYYDVDSLSDSCIVQYSVDSGVTWNDYSFNSVLSGNIDFDYNYDSIRDPRLINKFLWTGESTGWERVKICFTFYLVSPNRSLPDKFGYRFLFKSDSVQNNKPGWVIDKVRFKTPNAIGATKDFQRTALPIYPNPSQNGIFNIDFPSTYVTGKFMVYDYLGRNVKTVPLAERVDLSSLPAGLYSYKALFQKTNQWFSGKLEIQ